MNQNRNTSMRMPEAVETAQEQLVNAETMVKVGPTEAEILKGLEKMNLIDDFLMTAAASYGEEGRELVQVILETIIQRKLPNLRIEVQKVVPAVDVEKHGIRMDVLVTHKESEQGGEERESVYDIEMEKNGFVPKRARFYHSLADRKLLHAGDRYELLGNVFVIIIMPNDPFGKDRIMYTIKRMVVEDTSIEYDDGDMTFYLYTKGTVTDEKQELVDLLHYVENSVEENANNPELKKIHGIIQKVKHDEEVGVNYMKAFEREQMIREEERKKSDGKVAEANARASEAEAKANEEKNRANEEKSRADEEKNRANEEKNRADQAVAELERIREELRRMQESSK